MTETHIPTNVANEVLHFYDEGGYPAGSFTHALITAISRADPHNQTKLNTLYPDYVAAVHMMQTTVAGPQNLRAIAREETIS